MRLVPGKPPAQSVGAHAGACPPFPMPWRPKMPVFLHPLPARASPAASCSLDATGTPWQPDLARAMARPSQSFGSLGQLLTPAGAGCACCRTGQRRARSCCAHACVMQSMPTKYRTITTSFLTPVEQAEPDCNSFHNSHMQIPLQAAKISMSLGRPKYSC